MDLLFKREQTRGKASRSYYKLWAKLELTEEEQELIRRYGFSSAVLIDIVQPELLRKSALIGFAAFVIGYPVINFILGSMFGLYIGWMGSFMLPLLVGIGVAYYYFHNNRETIYVKDLLHGRHFTCPSVVELARKEAGLETITGYFRQVLESAKHWDGAVKLSIQPLNREAAKRIILTGPVY